MNSPQWWRGKETHRSLDERLVRSLSHGQLPSFRQLKYLPKLLTPKEQKILAGLALVMICASVFLAVRLVESRTTPIAKSGGGYTEGLVGSVQYVNPILSQNNDADRDVISLVFSGLLKYDADRRLVADLAERYEISSDQKTYTFYLRKNATWHDGKPVTADDVVFTINRIQDPRVKSPLYFSFKDVYVRKADDTTVQFGIKKPFAGLLDLATKRIIPAHVWEGVSPEGMYLSSVNLKPVGSGAWKYVSLKKDKDGTVRSYVLARNDDYFDTKPFLDRMTMKFYPDNDSAIQALKNKNVEGVSFLPRELRDRLAKRSDVKYYTYNLPQYTAVFFNQSLNADLKSKAVRQALALGVDRERIVREALAGEGSVIHAPILSGFVGYAPNIASYPFDVTRAAALLDAAGWKKNDAGILQKNQSTGKKDDDSGAHALSVTLTTINTSENARVADIIKENWTALGVQVEVQLQDPGQIKESVIDARNYQALLYGEIIGTDPDLYPFWHSSQGHAPGLNLAVYSNSKADTLLEAGRETIEEEKRTQAYQAFQDILAEEVPAIFLYNPSYNYVVSSSVQGIRDKKQIVYPSDRFVDSNLWYTKTKRVWKK